MSGGHARSPRGEASARRRPGWSIFARGPGSWRDGGLVQRLRLHSTGLTIASVAVIAVALSVLPLPDWARPFPELLEKPRETALAALLRRSERPPEATPGLPQAPAEEEAATALAAGDSLPEPAHTGPLEPSAE